jgi:hypothetical protein
MTIPFDYIAIIDRDQAGNSLYLKSFSRALRNQSKLRGIFIHADNQRTENMIQDGVMREQARKRVTRETTKRLVDMFAEAGAVAVGMQGWQIVGIENEVILKIDPREKIPTRTHLVLSNQIHEDGTEMDLLEFANQMAKLLSISTVIRFKQTADDGIFVHKQNPSTKVNTKPDSDGDLLAISVLVWDLEEWSDAESLLAG